DQRRPALRGSHKQSMPRPSSAVEQCPLAAWPRWVRPCPDPGLLVDVVVAAAVRLKQDRLVIPHPGRWLIVAVVQRPPATRIFETRPPYSYVADVNVGLCLDPGKHQPFAIRSGIRH